MLVVTRHPDRLGTDRGAAPAEAAMLLQGNTALEGKAALERRPPQRAAAMAQTPGTLPLGTLLLGTLLLGTLPLKLPILATGPQPLRGRPGGRRPGPGPLKTPLPPIGERPLYPGLRRAGALSAALRLGGKGKHETDGYEKCLMQHDAGTKARPVPNTPWGLRNPEAEASRADRAPYGLIAGGDAAFVGPAEARLISRRRKGLCPPKVES